MGDAKGGSLAGVGTLFDSTSAVWGAFFAHLLLMLAIIVCAAIMENHIL
jgi:hypothetical protein